MLFRRKVSEAGKRNSSVDQARIQEAHDHMVGLGAECATQSKEASRFAEALKVDDSLDSTRDAVRKAAQALFCDTDQYGYSSPYIYVRDLFDHDAIIQCGDCMYQVPYEKGVGDDQDGDDVVLGEPMEVDLVYVPSADPEADEQETAGDDIVEALREEHCLIRERNIPQSTRKNLDPSDFAGKGRSFPIVKTEDVKAALSSIGRAGSSNYPAGKLKSRILAIAQRKGFPIPKSDQEAIDSEKVTGTEAARTVEASEFVQLKEAALDANGDGLIKIIQPGWGSSGYYSPEVLKRDGPKIFSKGLKMFWDHQTAAEEAARPEGSLQDLAAELTGDAKWMQNGPAGPALYAPFHAHEQYRPAVSDLAKSIGVSIRASGRASAGKAEGKEGPIIQSLESAKSIDFVTSPGAGGEILQLFEAARVRKPKTEEADMEAKDLKEANTLLAQQGAEIAKLRETVLIGQAATLVSEKLAGVQLPAVTKQRLQRELVAAMPIKEGALDKAAFETQITEAVKTAAAEVVAITGSGEIRGMGPTQVKETTAEETTASLTESFKALGLGDNAAKIAAQGRN